MCNSDCVWCNKQNIDVMDGKQRWDKDLNACCIALLVTITKQAKLAIACSGYSGRRFTCKAN